MLALVPWLLRKFHLECQMQMVVVHFAQAAQLVSFESLDQQPSPKKFTFGSMRSPFVNISYIQDLTIISLYLPLNETKPP